MSLSEEQRAAVAHDHPVPAIVDAGAGTGKTFTIVERVAAICDAGKLTPSQILLLTFGKKAAGELQRRLVNRLGPQVEQPLVATFHAFALGVLRQYAYDLTISPDLNLINEVDARLEFALAFGELERGDLPEDASNYCLRFPLRDEVRESLFLIVQKLKDTGIGIEAFRRRALGAADDFARVPYRELVQENKRGLRPGAKVSDAEFDAQIKAERARVEAACALFRRFDERLALRGALTYADLLLLAENALRERPTIAHDLRRRFKHCIVDEFQDTDPRQDSLLEAIFGGFAGVMAVGDPRQSIYGFRGADPRNFEVFRKSDRCADYALSENRRSRQEILDLGHHLISPHSGDASPLRAARGSAQTQVVHVSAGFARPGSPPPNAEESRKREGSAVARRIAWMLQSGRSVEESGRRVALGPRHIAILSRNKTKIQPYTDALIEFGIPYRLFGGVGFYDAPEVIDALSWMKLLADPFDSIPLARAAASPGIGISDATLSELNPVPAAGQPRGAEDADIFARRLLVDPLADGLNPQGGERIERLRKALEALENYAGAPVGLAYEAILERSGLARSAASSGARDAAQALANLRKLGSLARTFGLRNPGARPADFVGYIYALEQSMEDDREADPPSADALSVMTIHAAKGLEWPIVFIVDVWPRGQHDKLPVRVDDRTGALIVSEGGDGVRPFHTHALQEDADSRGHTLPRKDRAKDDSREREERRLYYVAVTRARDELFISGKRGQPSKSFPGGKPDDFLADAIAWMENRGWPLDEPLPPLTGALNGEAARQLPLALAAVDSEPSHTDAGSEIAEFEARPEGVAARLPRAPAKFRVPTLSFSLLTRFERCARQVNYELALGLPPLAPGTSRQVEDDQIMPDILPLSLGGYGRLVHRSLELWLRRTIDRACEPLSDARAIVERAAADLSEHVARPDAERANAAVCSAAAALCRWRPLHVEAPFVLDYGGIAVSGYIDLMATDPDGRLTVVDFKTGEWPVEDYRLQFGLYADGARRAYKIAAQNHLVGRVGDGPFAFEAVEPLDAAQVEARVRAATSGIESGDVTPRPGAWCRTCPYRAAPCMDYAS